jgi:hypothetical protein
MNRKNFSEMLRKEDAIPFAVVLIGIVSYLFEYAAPMTNKLLESNEVMTAQDILILGGLGVAMTVMLVAIIFVIKRVVTKDVAEHKVERDEREVMHNYLVAKSGYYVLLIGLCGYLFLFSGNELVDYYLLILVAVALVVRIAKRKKLEKEY